MTYLIVFISDTQRDYIGMNLRRSIHKEPAPSTIDYFLLTIEKIARNGLGAAYK